MFNFQKILQEISQSIYCPICKRKYNPKEIKVRGFLDETLILEVKCNNHHNPAVALIIAERKRNQQAHNNKVNPITPEEGKQFKQNIRCFHGNFLS